MADVEAFTKFFSKLDEKKQLQKNKKSASKEKSDEKIKVDSQGWVEETASVDVLQNRLTAGSKTVVVSNTLVEEQPQQEVKRSEAKWATAAREAAAEPEATGAQLSEKAFPKLGVETVSKKPLQTEAKGATAWSNSALRQKPQAKTGTDSWYEATKPKSGSTSNIYGVLGSGQ